MTVLKLKTKIDKLFKKEEAGESLSEPIRLIQDESKKALEDLGRPTIKDENWKYTSTRWLENSVWEIPSHSDSYDREELDLEEKANQLVFVDGAFQGELSNVPFEGISIKPLEEAFQGNAVSFEEKEFFPLMNKAFLREGLFIEVEGQFSKEEVFEFVFLWSKRSFAKAAFTKNVLNLSKNASLWVKEVHRDLEGEDEELGTFFSNTSLEIKQEEGSFLRYKKLFQDSVSHNQFSEIRAHLAKNASFKAFFASLGGTLYRQDTHVDLAGEGSHTTLNGLFLSKNENTSDFCFHINHKAPKTTSSQYFKGLAKDQSKGIFQGKIFVSEDAAETRSKQLNKNLILNPGAEIYTKPQLQIDTDDVKCSHGATISRVREDELFYLQTRGLSRKTAMDFLVTAFLAELLEIEKKEDLDIFESEIKESIREMVSQKKLEV